jgi:hypothetical protein
MMVPSRSSADGYTHTCPIPSPPSVAFPAKGSLQVGLHAIGVLSELIYPGGFPDGTAIRFESFTIWGLDR